MPSLNRLSEGPLPRFRCKSDLSQPIRLGVSRLDGFNIDEVWDYMLKPITGLQCAILVAEHQQELIPWVDKYVVRVMCCGSERRARSARWLRLWFLILAPCSHACVLTICRYNSFLICLGMVRPVQVDGIWDKNHLAYNKYMASLLPRSMYYRLQRLLRTDVTDLLEECNSVWSAAWHIGGAVCGDEAIVPHTGGRCMGPWQYIARKPHATGIKLYILGDNTRGGTLWTSTSRRVRRFRSCAGNFDAKRIVGLWSRLISPGTVFMADTFFGSHAMAQDLSARGTPYLMLIKKDKRDAGLTKAKQSTQEGDCARAIVDGTYEPCVYKNPKVGHKPPKIIPFLTNCGYGVDDPARDRRGNNLPAVVAKYREVSRAVDGADQMVLQMRQITRSHDVRAFMLRYAAGNAFATCKAWGLVDEKTTMWEFQWDILKRQYFAEPDEPAARPESVVHAPVRHTQRKLCTYCGEG